MKKIFSIALTLLVLAAVHAAPVFACGNQAAAATADEAAPDAAAPAAAADTTGGGAAPCAGDGSCCGAAECAHAQKRERARDGSGAGNDDCPCKRNKPQKSE